MMTRNPKGQFAAGHEKIGGRKTKAAEEKVLDLFRAAVSDADITAIVNRAVIQAKAGDAIARKFIFDYMAGPPVEKKEITGADGETFFVTLLGQDERSKD